MLRARMRKRLRHRREKEMMSEFRGEVARREAQGYSAEQLLRSHVPQVGDEVKITEAEVNAALKLEDFLF